MHIEFANAKEKTYLRAVCVKCNGFMRHRTQEKY